MILNNIFIYIYISLLLLLLGDHGDNCSIVNSAQQKLSLSCKQKVVENTCHTSREITFG